MTDKITRKENYVGLVDKILSEHARPQDSKSKIVIFLTQISLIEPRLSKASGPRIDLIIGRRVGLWSKNPHPKIQPTKSSRLWMCVFYLALVAGETWGSESDLRALVKK